MATPVFLANVYELIFNYQNTSDTTLKWRTTHEIFSSSAPLPTDAIVTDLTLLAEAMADTDTTLETVACYAWARGTVPYPEGSALWIKTLGVPCTASSDWGTTRVTYVPGDKSLCLRIDKETVTSGRPGRNFIRALLGTGDVSSISGGKWQLVKSRTLWQEAFEVILADANVEQYFSAGSSAIKLVVVRYSPKTNTVHGYSEIGSMQIINATTAKGNRKSAR